MEDNPMKQRKTFPEKEALLKRLDDLHSQEITRLDKALKPVLLHITLTGDPLLTDPVQSSTKGGK